MAEEVMPHSYPVVDSSDASSMVQPSEMCPETWGDNVLGFDKHGRKTMMMDDHDPKPVIPIGKRG